MSRPAPPRPAWMLLAALALAACRRAAEPAPGFVGSQACAPCHEERHETWLDTAHAYALREPTEETVKGRFDGRPVESRLFTAYPERRPDGWFVRVEWRDGRPAREWRVDRVIGRALEQGYLHETERGEWQLLHLSWNLAGARWDLTHEVLSEISDHVGLYEDFDPANHVFNHGCAQCHATGYDAGYDEATGVYRPRLVEGSVACESCHGPGSRHVEAHRAGAEGGRDYRWPLRLVQPADDLDPEASLRACARCHYRQWYRFPVEDDPRVPHLDVAASSNFDQHGFFADGRVAGLSYHGTTLVQSPCHLEGGMDCVTCHDLHTGLPWGMRWAEESSDEPCAACHAELVRDPRPHTRHADVRCVECHMPKLLDGVLAGMRDHSLGSPEPELTARFGAEAAPNACNACHADRDAAWAQAAREEGWGPTPPRLVEDVGTVVAIRTGTVPVPTRTLLDMALDPDRRLFFRMTALRELAPRSGEPVREALRTLLLDPRPDLRQLAAEAVALHPDPAAVPALLELLADRFRVTRVEAAYALARCGFRGPDPRLAAVHREAQGMLERRRVFDDAYLRLAFLADAAGFPEEAGRHLDALLRIAPWRDAPPAAARDLFQRRGRALAERGEHAAALEWYGRASAGGGELAPSLLRLDAAESLLGAGRTEDGRAVLLELATRESSRSAVGATAAFRLARLGGGAEAERRALEEVVARLSDDPAAGELLRRARGALR